MFEPAGDFEWRGEGEEAEVVLYAPDGPTVDAASARALYAAGLPGVESPAYVATSEGGFGLVAASASHAAPDLVSAPARGLLLVADVSVGDLGMRPEDVPPFLLRGLAETRLPSLNDARVRRVCEGGAHAAAEDGLIEEEDLPLLGPAPGDPDTLARRAISAGTRDWGISPEELDVFAVGGLFDAEGAGSLGLEPGMLALVIRAGSGELGRLALAGHRERILARIMGGEDLGSGRDLPATPTGTEEAADLVAASHAAANLSDGRAALYLYALRRVLEDFAGDLGLRAAWTVGGFETPNGSLVHRRDLASTKGGSVLVSGGFVTAGTGNMLRSAPPFGAPEIEGRWPWEEAGLLERWAGLDAPGRGV